MPAITGYNQAQASFVPFVVENAEWILSLLAGLGITFMSQSDALSGVHKFAYDLDQTAYSALQGYIEQVKFGQDVKKAIAIGGLQQLGILDTLAEGANALISSLITEGVLLIDYIQNIVTPSEIEGDYSTFTFRLGSHINIPYIVPETLDETIVIAKVENTINNIYDTTVSITKTKTVLLGGLSGGTVTTGLNYIKLYYQAYDKKYYNKSR